MNFKKLKDVSNLLRLFTKHIPWCSYGVQCPLPMDDSIHSTLNTLTILTELGLKGGQSRSTEWPPLRNLLIRLNALFMWDQKTFALLNASILSPPKPQFRPHQVLLMLHLAAFCWELCHCLDWVSHLYQSS